MVFEFKLPDLGEGITEGEIRKWLVKEGDEIEEHQSVVELETDKAVVEVPSPRKGTVLKIPKEDGSTVQVGEVLLVIGEAGEEAAEGPAEKKMPEKGKPEEEKPAEKRAGKKTEEKKKPAEAGEKPKAAAEEKEKSVSVVGFLPEEEEEEKPAKKRERPKPAPARPPETQGKGVLAVPAVRALARERGVGLEKIKGTGPEGSITREDVLKAAGPAPKAAAPSGPEERIAIRGLRKTIAKRLVLSQQTTAFVTETDEADITDLWDLRKREKQALEGQGVHLTFMPFFMKAILHSLMEFPAFNASVDEEREEIVIKKYYNMGVAVDTPEGLIVPVVRDVDRKTIRRLAEELQDLSQKARERTIKLEDLKGNTFTITNYGAFGSTFATPIINYPDVAILGTGKIMDKPWVKDGAVVVRKVLPLSLTFDHRVNDGAGAAKFLTKLVGYLEDPASVLIEST